MTLSLTFHGAARTVTGSCMELQSGDSRILIDCGLFQGSRSLEALNTAEPSFRPRQIDAVVLTHAHIDHSGLLPRLVAQGFAGPVWCTRETMDLLEFMLADAGRIQEYEAEQRARRRDRGGDEPIRPLYTEADAIAGWQACRPVELGEAFAPAPGFSAKLWNAGHILGSASAEIEAQGVRALFSGDIGPDNKAFHPDPDAPSGYDFVVCESTYGDRTRDRVTIDERRALLKAEILAAQARGGNLIIPTFALERTQELLLDIAALVNSGQVPHAVVYVDSPLANQATRVFARHAEDLEDIGALDVFNHPAIHYVRDVAESIRLNSVSGAIILAASGMCEAGRIRHHLLHNLHRRDSTVLFVGFQAQGSLGRVILEGAERVRISGRDVMVRAQIRRIDSYSAHADQSELLDWIRERGPIAGSLILDHGEAEAIEALRRLAQSESLAGSIIVPELGECYALEPGQPAKRTRTCRPEAAVVTGRDWQNEYADLVTGLRQKLGAIHNEAARREAIERMRKVLDSYEDHRERKKRERG